MLSIRGKKGNTLAGKRITLCLSGSVAVVRVPELARELIRHGAQVRCVASDAAMALVGEPLLEWASENEVVTSITGKIEHVRLGAYADLVLVCPATANTIGKIAQGIDDTPVTSTVTCAIGADKPVIVVPAMHESMYRHPIVAENIEKLQRIGVKFALPRLAEGKAKIAESAEIVEMVIAELAEKTLAGKKIVITAGPTYEAIDAVRGITNMSSGKMGVELAKEAHRRGAEVTLVYGPGCSAPSWMRAIGVVSEAEMAAAVKAEMRGADVLISAAAIADYTPVARFGGKLSSSAPRMLELRPTGKLVAAIRALYPNKTIVGFKLESEQLVERAYAKLLEDGLDLIVANSPAAIGAEASDAYIINRRKKISALSGSKQALACAILDSLATVLESKAVA